jgi:hypothetical protein
VEQRVHYLKEIVPDPRNRLRVLIDEELRNKDIKANVSSKPLQTVHVSGISHTYWIDGTTGFTKED